MKPTVLAVILAMAFAPAWAQNPNPGDPNSGDAPDHGVARLSIVQGNVSMRHGDLGELAPAANNVPLVTTDRVVTGDAGRAEIQFDFNNMIRLAPSSEVRLSQLEFKRYQVQIAAGITEFRVLQVSDAQVEISTPTVSVHPSQPGAYRIAVRPDGITEITVRSGQAEIYGPRGSEDLGPGQTMEVRGSIDSPEFQMTAAVPMDDFDRWNGDRDKVMQQTSSYRPGYVPPDVTGGEALDQYGQWQSDPGYGQVWVPAQSPGWAPYQNGRWVWEDYYGWTWVSQDPWGWAPYHYGNWYMSSWGWAWWPGVWGPHYYWRPALVGFFGWGPGIGFGVGFGFGNLGWVPLAPFERFHPWYGSGLVAGGRLGVTNVNVTSVYRNARVTNAVSSMRANDFGRGGVNGANMVRPNAGSLASAGALHGALPVTRTAGSSRVSDAVVNSHGMPQTGSNTRFYSRGAAGPTARTSAPAAAAPAWRGFNGYNGGGANASGGANTGGSFNRGGNAGGNPPSGNGPAGTARSYGSETQRGNPGAVSRGGEPQSNYRSGTPSATPSVTPQNRAPSQQQPLRMNPPIVQQRSAPSAPSTPAPRSGGGGGGSVSRGGGGGGNRGGGGGGGGSHGGGGGGGHR